MLLLVFYNKTTYFTKPEKLNIINCSTCSFVGKHYSLKYTNKRLLDLGLVRVQINPKPSTIRNKPSYNFLRCVI